MNAATPNDNEENKAVGTSTKTKLFDREASARTLPDGSYCEAAPRPVMSPAPIPSGGGAHSQRGFAQRGAAGVASVVGARAPAAEAVPDAAREATRRAKLAGVALQSASMHNAINAIFGNEEKQWTVGSVIEAATTLLNAVDKVRDKRKDTEPQPSTLVDYARKCMQVDEALEDVDGPFDHRLRVAMGGWAAKWSTFNFMRSALRQRGIDGVRTGLADLLSLQGGVDFFSIQPQMAKDLLRETGKLSLLFKLNQKDCLAAVGGKAKAPSSKCKLLDRLKAGWREDFLAMVDSSDAYAMPCAILTATGLRPVELAKGVRLAMRGEKVHVTINGGKVRSIAGQPWREMELSPEALPAWAYAEVKRAGSMTVSAEEEAHRKYIGRVSEKLYPRHVPPRASDILLSPYVFRHALVSDLRAEGWRDEEIAGVIGESSAETVKWYGKRWGTGGRRSHKARASGIDKASVETARPVKSAPKSGLDQFKDATKRSRSKVGLRRSP